MKLVVALGNPGKEYDMTRHNMGFMFVDYYFDKKNINVNWSNKFNGLYCDLVINSEKIIFVKPQSYMNLSGGVVRKFVDFYKIKTEDILVISDDLDLSLGNFKLKMNGSSGGHNGLKDIEKKLGTQEYKRLKIGISKNNNYDTKDYVLSKFSSEEKKVIDTCFDELINVFDDYFTCGYSQLMNKYNKKNR